MLSIIFAMLNTLKWFNEHIFVIMCWHLIYWNMMGRWGLGGFKIQFGDGRGTGMRHFSLNGKFAKNWFYHLLTHILSFSHWIFCHTMEMNGDWGCQLGFSQASQHFWWISPSLTFALMLRPLPHKHSRQRLD